MSDEAIVLAAGKGTRMRSTLPKVLHSLAGKPMLLRVLDSLSDTGFSCPTVVVGYGTEQIDHAIGHRSRLVMQEEQRGTGDAARVALEALGKDVERVLVVHGDEPLIPGAVLSRMLALQATSGASVVLLTTHVDETRGFGRVIRDPGGEPCALLQEADLSAEQRSLKEVNLGAYVFTVDIMRRYVASAEPHAPKGEYYLTDIVRLASANSGGVQVIELPHGTDIMGINDLVQLEQATGVVFRRTNRLLMESGVTIIDSSSTFVDENVRIQPDTIIYPFTVISGDTSIGGACRIGPRAHIVNSHIGDGCEVLSSTLEEATVADGVRIGPYAHLRPGARIGTGAEIGNYAEIKNTTVGAGTKMHHVSYLGDADVGVGVNIGAGTVTCNYDGARKHRTVIEDDAFIGSDTMLRAPVTVGAGAFTGAGSVVTRDVPPGSVAFGVPARIIKQVRPQQPSRSEE
ncbi:MAG: bifunctional UDP-N-acetylglucosamine diphosphorylase/glucosamine-1-phosphate N-acetyltransferase GlmU [Chloroflexota bacterium]